MFTVETEPRSTVLAVLERHRAGVDRVGLAIPTDPEVTFAEHRAGALATGWRAERGFAVTQPEGGLETAFVARHTGSCPAPAVAVIADRGTPAHSEALRDAATGQAHERATLLAAALARTALDALTDSGLLADPDFLAATRNEVAASVPGPTPQEPVEATS